MAGFWGRMRQRQIGSGDEFNKAITANVLGEKVPHVYLYVAGVEDFDGTVSAVMKKNH